MRKVRTIASNRTSGNAKEKPLAAGGHGMRVISQSPDPLARMHTMTKRQGKSRTINVQALLAEDEDFLRVLVQTALQKELDAEMAEALAPRRASERRIVPPYPSEPIMWRPIAPTSERSESLARPDAFIVGR
jgi:hypothetical protein